MASGVNRTIKGVEIPQPSIFGRIGTGIGQGLAESMPDEIKRGRFESGIQALEKESANLSPSEYVARVANLPGSTPQLVQTLGELARYRNQGNAYKNRAGMPDDSNVPQGTASPQQGQQQNIPVQQTFNVGAPQQQQGQQQAPEQGKKALTNEKTPAYGENQLGENAADPNGLARFPFTPQQMASHVNEYIGMGFLPPEAKELAREDEARYLAEGKTFEERRQQKKGRIQEADDELTKSLETRLQKTGEGVYKDITGDMIQDLKREMNRELVLHPEASTRDIADNFSKRALALAETKNELKTLAATTGIESIFQGDKNLTKLRNFQKVFAKAGNEKEYARLLREQLGLSPQGANVIAFPASNDVNKYIKNYKPSHMNLKGLPDADKIDANARKAAIEISDIISDKDSLLAIARMLSEKDHLFDQRAFFEQLGELTDSRFNDRQGTEQAVGERDFLPTWGDIKIFPSMRRSTK